MVVEKRTIIKAPNLFLAESFPTMFSPARADMKLGAFLPLVGFSSYDSSAQL
jgi:hypothetical protein